MSDERSLHRRALLGALLGLPAAGGLAFYIARRGGDSDHADGVDAARDHADAAGDRADGASGDPAPWRRALAIILTAVGPWRSDDRDGAAALIDASLRAITPAQAPRYEAMSGTLATLAARLGGAYAVDDVDLGGLDADQRQVLLALVSQLYAALPVRFYAAGEPPPGVCVADPTWHTRPPEPP